MIRKYYEYSGLGGDAGEAKKPLTKEQLLIPRYMCTGTPEYKDYALL